MPRTSRLQGIAMGLSVLGARATAGAAERLTRVAMPAEAPLGKAGGHARGAADVIGPPIPAIRDAGATHPESARLEP